MITDFVQDAFITSMSGQRISNDPMIILSHQNDSREDPNHFGIDNTTNEYLAYRKAWDQILEIG